MGRRVKALRRSIELHVWAFIIVVYIRVALDPSPSSDPECSAHLRSGKLSGIEVFDWFYQMGYYEVLRTHVACCSIFVGPDSGVANF